MVLAAPVDGGGRDVVAPPPDQDLVLPVLVDGLLLVEALEGAVVPLVELPRLRLGDPHQVGLLEDVPEGPDGALLERREGYGGDDPGLLDELPGLDDLLVSLGGEGHVDPPRELVLEVPGRLAVADEDEGVLVGRLEGGEAALHICIDRG